MMDDVECEGTEEKLLDCNHKTKDDCKGNEGLGVICTPKKGEVQEPTHNEMKCVLSIKESYSKEKEGQNFVRGKKGQISCMDTIGRT